jgi:23S rRNA pseudouridine2605 synthase
MAKTPRKRKKKAVRNERNPLIPRHREGRAIGRARAKKRDLAEQPAPAEVEVDGPREIRLNKLLADHGIASRRKCDELIAKGKVSVDGEPITELGTKVDPDRQVVDVDGVKLKGMQRRYYVLNKPAGVVCTNEERETRPRAIDLIGDKNKGRIYTVGRLDEESTGLILLTNDGDFANRVMHPRYGVYKTYSVRVAGRIDDEALNKVRDGVQLAEGRTGGARILVKRRSRDSSTLDVTIREGMNREIRRAFAGVGYKVVALRRSQIGPLTTYGLKTGHWRKLKRAELRELLNPPAEPPTSTRRPARGGAMSARAARAKASRRGNTTSHTYDDKPKSARAGTRSSGKAAAPKRSGESAGRASGGRSSGKRTTDGRSSTQRSSGSRSTGGRPASGRSTGGPTTGGRTTGGGSGSGRSTGGRSGSGRSGGKRSGGGHR